MEMIIYVMTALVMIAAIMFLYPIFSNILLEHVFPSLESTRSGMDLSDTAEERIDDTQETLENAWIWGSLILIGGIVTALFMFASRKEYIPEYG